MGLRVARLALSNAPPPTTGSAWRVSLLFASSADQSVTVSVSPRLVDLEPYSTVTISGTGSSVGSWSQVAGAGVTLLGSGASRTYVAPATPDGSVLRFSYAVSGQSAVVEHVVLPATELMPIGQTLRAVRWLQVVNGSLT